MASTSQPASLPFRGVENDRAFYNRLDPALRQIRYVDLHPGDVDEPLVCSLAYTSLDLDVMARVHYEALSYCWGSIDDQVDITLLVPLSYSSLLCKMLQLDTGDALASSSKFRITRTLESALLALRREQGMRRLWIDAICINQMDDSEKTHQVGQMSLIYASAKQVTVWLGNEDQHSQSILRGREILEQEILERLALDPYWHYNGPLPRTKVTLAKNDWAFIGKGFSSAVAKDEQLGDILDIPTDLEEEGGAGSIISQFTRSIDEFFGRPWFRRVWVYPEVILARCDEHGNRLVTVVTGKTSMRWQDLNEFVRTLEHISDTNGLFRARSGDNLTWYRDSWYWPTTTPHHCQDLSFVEYLARTVAFQASDPRDKLFALLALGRDTREDMHTNPRLRPDYEKSIIDIISDFGRAGISLPSNLTRKILEEPGIRSV